MFNEKRLFLQQPLQSKISLLKAPVFIREHWSKGLCAFQTNVPVLGNRLMHLARINRGLTDNKILCPLNSFLYQEQLNERVNT